MEELQQLHVLAMLSLAVGCASPAGEAKLRAPAEQGVAKAPAPALGATASNGVVLGAVQFRDTELIVHASTSIGGEIQFAVRDRGRMQPREVLSESELDRRYPELHQEYRNAVASGKILLDASLDRRLIDPPESASRNWRYESANPAAPAPVR